MGSVRHGCGYNPTEAAAIVAVDAADIIYELAGGVRWR